MGHVTEEYEDDLRAEAEVDALAKKLKDAERDARRYRWLRDDASRYQLELFADRRSTRLAADRVCDAGIDITPRRSNENSN